MSPETPTSDDEVGNEIRSQVGGWAMVPNWVMTVGLTPGEFAIYVAMRSFADRNGECYPTAKKIAERALGVSVKSVHNAFTKFRKMGLITTEVRPRPDGSTAGLFITMTDLPPGRPLPSAGKAGSPHSEGPGVPHTVKGPSPHSEGQEENTPEEHPNEEHPNRTTPPLRDDAIPGMQVEIAKPPSSPARRPNGATATDAEVLTRGFWTWAEAEGVSLVQKYLAVRALVKTALDNRVSAHDLKWALCDLGLRGDVVTTQSLQNALRRVRANGQTFRSAADQTEFDQTIARARERDAAGGSTW